MNVLSPMKCFCFKISNRLKHVGMAVFFKECCLVRDLHTDLGSFEEFLFAHPTTTRVSPLVPER